MLLVRLYRNLQAQFEEHLKKKLIPVGLRGLHKKWLRYYPDFRRKYHVPPAQGGSLPRYIQKLREKKQTTVQQEQAAGAITLYYEILKAKSPSDSGPLIQAADPQVNALLFFYRHVLKKEFGKIDGVVRAKRKPYIPVVLSREEIEAILKHLEPPYDLVVKLLYGC